MESIGLQQSKMTSGGPQDDSDGAEPLVFTSKLATRRWIGATRRRQRAPMATYLAHLMPSALPESTETSPLLSLFDPPPPIWPQPSSRKHEAGSQALAQ